MLKRGLCRIVACAAFDGSACGVTATTIVWLRRCQRRGIDGTARDRGSPEPLRGGDVQDPQLLPVQPVPHLDWNRQHRGQTFAGAHNCGVKWLAIARFKLFCLEGSTHRFHSEIFRPHSSRSRIPALPRALTFPFTPRIIRPWHDPMRSVA